MTHERARRLYWAALLAGIVLLAITLWMLDPAVVRAEARRLGVALPLVILVSGAWHLARTVAWAACFPVGGRVPFWRLARVRLAAEAFSYVTLRGIAGEPLKVLLLDREVDPREATAAVALERVAFMTVTTAIVGVGATVAMATLPLSDGWFRVFRAFAIAAAVVILLSAVVLTGRGTYLGWFDRHWGRVGRFIAAVERQMLAAARHHPKRLLVIASMDIISYALMALEAWVVLRAAGADIGFGGALAVETFTRVVGFASSFIPANLGALEASSVAAVAAVGAASGGAALAIARRIRGIFWAAAGLIVYPKPKPRLDGAGRVLVYVVPAAAASAAVLGRVAGLSIAERVFLAARKHGCGRVAIDAPGREAELARMAARTGLKLVNAECRVPNAERLTGDEGVNAEWRMPKADGDTDDPWQTPVTVEHGWIPRPGANGLEMLHARVLSAEDLPAAEREIRAAVFKPTDHNLAVFNRRLSLPISIALLPTPVTANQFSVALLFLGLYSAWLFAEGTYLAGVAGAAVSLAASILDGCDGEIARLKYQESAFGCWLETVTDYTYYFAIFIGMMVGMVRATGWSGFYWLGATALGGMLLSFLLLLYLRHRMTRGAPQKFGGTLKGKFKEGGAAWTRWLAKLSNVATRARMPYGILALALVDALPLVLVLCAIGANVYWIGLVLRFRSLVGEAVSARLSVASSR